MDYAASFNYPWANVALVISEKSTVDEWKKEFKKNCKTIVKCQNKLSQLELCRIMLKNLYCLVAIAKTEPFIF